jgi:CheY-like chemotaxis protein
MEARRPAVLVVDDEPPARAVAVEMMTSVGVPVFEARSGEDAWKVLSAHPEIAVLFTDIRMPEMTGTELAERAREMRPDLRVVLTSGEALPRRDGEFLPKAYRFASLRALIFGK